MTVAVNVADLHELKEGFPFLPLLLGDFASESSELVNVDPGRVDGYAVVLDGPGAADEERLAAVCSLLRDTYAPRVLRRPIRLFERGPRGGWRRLR